MKVLILSQVFPVNHPRKGEPTEFEEKYLSGEKIHTIRLNAKNYFKDGDDVSVRKWSAKPRCSSQVIIRGRQTIGIEPCVLDYAQQAATFPRHIPFSEIAKNDGLSVADFNKWFFPSGKRLEPVVACFFHFTEFRYTAGRLEACGTKDGTK